MVMQSDLQQFKDDTAKSCFGMTKQEAINKNICISCKQTITKDSFYSIAGTKEYRISGLCEYCFDKICGA